MRAELIVRPMESEKDDLIARLTIALDGRTSGQEREELIEEVRVMRIRSGLPGLPIYDPQGCANGARR